VDAAEGGWWRRPYDQEMANTQSPPTDRQGQTPPGPDGWPLVGNTLSFLRDPISFYGHCAEAYDSDVVAYSIAGSDGYMITDPAIIERVLVTDDSEYTRGLVADTLGQVVDGGLLLLEGEEWQQHRSALQPSFYRDRIETYAAMMVRYATEQADTWEHGQTVAVSEQMRTLTLRILTKTLLDVDVEGDESTIGDAASTITDRFDASTLSAFLPLWVPTPRNRRANRAVDAFEGAIDDIIEKRQRSDGTYDDLLSIMLDVDDDLMDESDVRDHLFTFLFAGHETTSLALSYTLFCLANDPERQARLHAELDDVLGGDAPTAADLFELDYLERVVDEALRLYPPAYTMFREPERDVELGGYVIPEGSVLSLPQWVVHRDERWYDGPGQFRPERWAEGRDRPEYAYYPFGGGPRHCIGMRFARMELELVLATLAQRFQFHPVTEPPLDLSMQITLQPESPIEVGLAAR